MDNKKLTIQELDFVQQEVKDKGKNILISYGLAIALAPIGANRTYLGKVKSGVLKTILSIANIVSFKAILNATQANMTVEAIAESVNMNTALAILFLGLTSANLILFLSELLLIPKWINKWNLKVEQEATTKAIESRYVAESLTSEETTSHLIMEVKKEVLSRFQKEISEISAKLEEKLNNKMDVAIRNNNISMPPLPSINTKEKAILDVELPSNDTVEGEMVFDNVDIDSIIPGDIKDEYIDIQEIPEDFANLVELEFIDDDDFTSILDCNAKCELTNEDIEIKETQAQMKKAQEILNEEIKKIEKEEREKEQELIDKGLIPPEEQVELVLEEVVDKSGVYDYMKNLQSNTNLFDYKGEGDLSSLADTSTTKVQSMSLDGHHQNVVGDESECPKHHSHEKTCRTNNKTLGQNEKETSEDIKQGIELTEKGLNVTVGEMIKVKEKKKKRRKKKRKK